MNAANETAAKVVNGRKITSLGLAKVVSVSTLSPRVTPRSNAKMDKFLAYQNLLATDTRSLPVSDRKPVSRNVESEHYDGMAIGTYIDPLERKHQQQIQQRAYNKQLENDKMVEAIPAVKISKVAKTTSLGETNTADTITESEVEINQRIAKNSLTHRTETYYAATRAELTNSPRGAPKTLTYMNNKTEKIVVFESGKAMEFGETNKSNALGATCGHEEAKVYEWTGLNVGGVATGNTISKSKLRDKGAAQVQYRNSLDRQIQQASEITKAADASKRWQLSDEKL